MEMSCGFCSKISYALQQCKNFENWLRFEKVTGSLKVGTFLRHSVEDDFFSFAPKLRTFGFV